MKSLLGVLSDIPGDKSITHRAIILSSIAEGESEIVGYLPSEDCKQTIRAFRLMGVPIDEEEATCSLRVWGRGLSGLAEPPGVVDCGNSGTALRLLTGILVGQEFHSVLTGDASLRSRPMRRVVDPLRQMGADIGGRSQANFAPLAIRGRPLTAIQYTLPIASAQVKSALLLAGLMASGTTAITDPHGTRDHTERMFLHFGAALKQEGNCCSITGGNPFDGKSVQIPGDFSSAAFFIVAALILPGSEIMIKRVGVNPTRTGLLDILKKMGANITVKQHSMTDSQRAGYFEPLADITVCASDLHGAGVVERALIPCLIDEFPILCVAAAAAEGETVIHGANELRVKESDRIKTMAKSLAHIAGVSVEEFSDGVKISGAKYWKRCGTDPCITEGDHRVAMAMKIASLRTDGDIHIDDETCINTSFPGFKQRLERLIR